MSVEIEQAATSPRRKRVERKRDDRVVGVRMTPEAIEKLSRRAKAVGLTKAGYIIQLIGGPVTKGQRRPTVDMEALGRTLAALGRVGNNLNQIAHSVNADMEIGDDAAATLREVRAVACEIMGAIGEPRRS